MRADEPEGTRNYVDTERPKERSQGASGETTNVDGSRRLHDEDA